MQAPFLACVEVGGSGAETVLFDDRGDHEVVPGAHQPADHLLAIAVPGLISGSRVAAASNLGWFDVDPVATLGLAGPAEVVRNDAEAAALGEAVLRHGAEDLVYVGLGTGVGGAVVTSGAVVAGNLFGHASGFGADACPCGRTGCLETVAAGWALPDALDERDLANAGVAIARAIESEPIAGHRLVVVTGGLVRNHPTLVEHLQAHLPNRQVETTRAPNEVKSAAAWGLRRLIAGAQAQTTPGLIPAAPGAPSAAAAPEQGA